MTESLEVRFDHMRPHQVRECRERADVAFLPLGSLEWHGIHNPLGLDAVARRWLYEELIGELADRGTTVFLTTHDLAGVEGIADRVGVLRDGRLLVNEELETLKARFRRLAWTEAEVPAERLEAGLQHVGVVASETMGGAVEAVVSGYDEVAMSRFAQEAPVEMVRSEALSLEEIFIALCGEAQGGL